MKPQSPDARWMRLALSLGRRGLGQVWPNPSVGCVLVRDNQVVGRGWTQNGGCPHGEVMALAQAGTRARRATAYVTLEPCAHHGKTPPCAQALIDAGVSRVVSALQDPDKRVSGKGHAMLERVGIPVTTGIMANQAAADHVGFLTRVNQNRPMITLKLAASLDGRIATHTGDSRWVTGPAARRAVHMMRASHDAVMVGSGTVMADDPDLTVRGLGLANCSPVRVIIDTNLRTPVNSRLCQTAKNTPLWLCHGPNAQAQNLKAAGARFIPCETDETGQIDLQNALAQLAEAGLTRIFCEGGGQLAASLLRLGLVDRLISFTAGVAIGGDGKAQIGPLGINALSNAQRFCLLESRILGGDIMSIWQPDRNVS